MGVRQMEMTNKFDNALTGVTGDDDTQGVIVNVGNFTETGHFWKQTACPGKPFGKDQHDKHQYNLGDESDGAIGRDALFGAVLRAVRRLGRRTGLRQPATSATRSG